MSEALAFPQGRPVLRVVKGNTKGRKYILNRKTRFTLGRSEENDIVINDLKCSRNQALLEYRNGQIKIKNLSQKNPVLVNGTAITSTVLINGAVLQIGKTQFRFQMEINEKDSEHGPLITTAARPLKPVHHPEKNGPAAPLSHSAPHSHQKNHAKKGNSNFPIIAIFVVGVLVWLITAEEDTKEPELIRSRLQQIEDTETLAKRNELLKQNLIKSGQNSQQFQNAQSMYLQGFRDYQKGRYSRSLQYFTATLNLYPSHKMAEVYRKKANKKLGELIQYFMIRGRQYREQNKFDFCVASLKNVLILVRDRRSAIYEEAFNMKTECELLMEGRY